MGLFNSRGFLHLKGINDTKHLTSEKDVLVLPDEYAKKIYVPIVDSTKGLPLNLVSKVGDEVKGGTLIGTRNMFGNEIPVYSPVSGKIIGEETIMHGILGRPTKHYVIENDFKYDNIQVIKPFDINASSEEIIEAMRVLNCAGLGGAGFPTFIKYKGVKDIDTLIINGVECEPYLTTDYVAMINNAENLIKGVQLMLKASGASKAFICIKKNKVKVKDALEPLLKDITDIELKLVKDVFPMGWERLLVKTVTGRTYDKLPSEAHVIVNNVQTAIELYKSSVSGFIITHKQITVSGEGIKNNANVIVPIGTKVKDIVEFMGGYTIEEGIILLGGPMCSKSLMNDNVPLMQNMDAITCLKKIVRPTQPCLRCGACTSHCPAQLQPVEIKLAVEHKDIERLLALNPLACVGCGLCSYDCPSYIEVSDFVKKGKILANIELTKRNNKK